MARKSIEQRQWDVPGRDLLDIERETQAQAVDALRQWARDTATFLRQIGAEEDQEEDADTLRQAMDYIRHRAGNLLHRMPTD